jgi:hypothetical protein
VEALHELIEWRRVEVCFALLPRTKEKYVSNPVLGATGSVGQRFISLLIITVFKVDRRI